MPRTCTCTYNHTVHMHTCGTWAGHAHGHADKRHETEGGGGHPICMSQTKGFRWTMSLGGERKRLYLDSTLDRCAARETESPVCRRVVHTQYIMLLFIQGTAQSARETPTGARESQTQYTDRDAHQPLLHCTVPPPAPPSTHQTPHTTISFFLRESERENCKKK